MFNSGDWLHAPPTASGLRQSDDDVRVVVAHRLGTNIVLIIQCKLHTDALIGGRAKRMHRQRADDVDEHRRRLGGRADEQAIRRLLGLGDLDASQTHDAVTHAVIELFVARVLRHHAPRRLHSRHVRRLVHQTHLTITAVTSAQTSLTSQRPIFHVTPARREPIRRIE